MFRATSELRSAVAVCCLLGLAFVAFAPEEPKQFFVPAAPMPLQMQPMVSAPALDMRMPVQYQDLPIQQYQEAFPMPMQYAEPSQQGMDPLILGLGLLSLGGGVAMLAMSGASSKEPSQPPRVNMQSISMNTAADWSMKQITPDGKLKQRVEGTTRKTWKFNDPSKDRVQVCLNSEGRPIHSELQLWLGPDYTPYTLKAYSEDGKLRPVQALVGTRNKSSMIEVRNVGDSTFPFSAASNYAQGAMAALPHEMPETLEGERVDGGALRSFPIDQASEKVEVMLNTEGRHMKARVELLNAPNNPKQTFEVYTSDGNQNSLCVCFNLPDQGNTIRIVNLLTVEYPMYIRLNEY